MKRTYSLIFFVLTMLIQYSIAGDRASLSSAEVETLMSEVQSHYEQLGYRVTAVGKMSTELHPQMYHMTFHAGSEGCVQTITFEKQLGELKINYLGEIDCR